MTIGPNDKTHAYVSDAELGEVAEELKRVDRRGGFERVGLKGKLILERCYGGSEELFRSHSKLKKDGIRRLAARGDCGSKSSLSRAVHVHLALKRMPWVLDTAHLKVSHLDKVTSKSHDEQERLLRMAEANGMSPRTLRNVITRANRAAGEKRGHPPDTPAARVSKHADRCLGSIQALRYLADLKSREDFTPEDVEKVGDRLEALADAFARLEEDLELLRKPTAAE